MRDNDKEKGRRIYKKRGFRSERGVVLGILYVKV
jgi:hypothetical protein